LAVGGGDPLHQPFPLVLDGVWHGDDRAVAEEPHGHCLSSAPVPPVTTATRPASGMS